MWSRHLNQRVPLALFVLCETGLGGFCFRRKRGSNPPEKIPFSTKLPRRCSRLQEVFAATTKRLYRSSPEDKKKYHQH